MLWSPFNVSINLNPTNDGSSISNNIANGEVIKFETVSGGIRFPIEVTKGATTEPYSFDIRPISLGLLQSATKLDAIGIPKRMGPGGVITFGLRDTYRVDLKPSGRSNNPITVMGAA